MSGIAFLLWVGLVRNVICAQARFVSSGGPGEDLRADVSPRSGKPVMSGGAADLPRASSFMTSIETDSNTAAVSDLIV